MSDWLKTKWALILIGCLLVAGVVIGLGIFFRQEVASWCDWAGNVATVLGLALSLVGFALTIWVLLDTQRISRQAEQAIERAMLEAQQQTREAREKIGLFVLLAEVNMLLRFLGSVRDHGGRGGSSLSFAARRANSSPPASKRTLISSALRQLNWQPLMRL